MSHTLEDRVRSRRGPGATPEVALDAATIRAYVLVADPADRRYLRSETIVHLLRLAMAHAVRRWRRQI